MTRALNYREYRDTRPFRAPAGIVSLDVDSMTGMPATPSCPQTRPEVYIAGTEPVGFCTLHGGRGGPATVAGWEAAPAPATQPSGTSPRFIGGAEPTSESLASRAARQAAGAPLPAPVAKGLPPPPKPEEKKQDQQKKKGIFSRIIGVFK
jgi:hypothetical protein